MQLEDYPIKQNILPLRYLSSWRALQPICYFYNFPVLGCAQQTEPTAPGWDAVTPDAYASVELETPTEVRKVLSVDKVEEFYFADHFNVYQG